MLAAVADDDIAAFQQKALEGSVFDDYGSMVLMRGIGAVVFAILLLLLVFYPLYVLLYRYLMRRFPEIGPNMYLKRHKHVVRNNKDYEEYLSWAARHGHEPVVPKKSPNK